MTRLFLSMFLFLSLKSWALGPPSISANQDGVSRYKGEDYSGAFNDFAKALGKDSYNPTYHFNLGDTFLKNGEAGKAISEFEAVEKNPQASTELKYKSMFNAGNAALQNKDTAKAMQYYQRALEYVPQSKEVKTNMELAMSESKGGGGGDDKKDKKDQKSDDNKKDDKQQQQPKQDDSKQGQKEEPKQPKPFRSQALNENDVRRILEELKRQEEQIRAKQNMDNKKTPEQQVEKDW